MPQKSELVRHAVVVPLLALFFLFFEIQQGRFAGYTLEVDSSTVVLFGSMFLVVLSVTRDNNWIPRTVLGAWLALFMLYGLEEVQRTVSWNTELRYDHSPWLGYFVVGLIIGLVLIAVALKRVTILGAVKFTVISGLLMIFLNYVNSYFSADSYLVTGKLDWEDWSSAWLGLLNWWSYRGDWVVLVTYLGLGYLVARQKSLPLSMIIILAIGAADMTIRWLIVLYFSSLPLISLIPITMSSEYSGLLWSAVPRLIVVEASVLAMVGSIGAIAAHIGFWWAFQLPPGAKTAAHP